MAEMLIEHKTCIIPDELADTDPLYSSLFSTKDYATWPDSFEVNLAIDLQLSPPVTPPSVIKEDVPPVCTAFAVTWLYESLVKRAKKAVASKKTINDPETTPAIVSNIKNSLTEADKEVIIQWEKDEPKYGAVVGNLPDTFSQVYIYQKSLEIFLRDQRKYEAHFYPGLAKTTLDEAINRIKEPIPLPLRSGIEALIKYGCVKRGENEKPYDKNQLLPGPGEVIAQAEAQKQAITAQLGALGIDQKSVFRLETVAEMVDCLTRGYGFVLGISYTGFARAANKAGYPLIALEHGRHAVFVAGYDLKYDGNNGAFICKNNITPKNPRAKVPLELSGMFYLPFSFLQDKRQFMSAWTIIPHAKPNNGRAIPKRINRVLLSGTVGGIGAPVPVTIFFNDVENNDQKERLTQEISETIFPDSPPLYLLDGHTAYNAQISGDYIDSNENRKHLVLWMEHIPNIAVVKTVATRLFGDKGPYLIAYYDSKNGDPIDPEQDPPGDHPGM